MDDFVRCAVLLAAPGTEPAQRQQADAWLAAFRADPSAWTVALAVLRSAAAAPPEVRLQAASLLAWKAKKQLGQLQPPERQAELAEVLAELAGQLAPADVAARGVCVALANLAIHCSGWARPLEALGSRLSQDRMLEFLTLLPQECEDAAAAAQSASAEVAWSLKARSHEWSPGVAAWLHSLHSIAAAAGSGGGSAASSPGGDVSSSPQQQQQQQRPLTAAAVQRDDWRALTAAVLRCFAAWVKWGCLADIHPSHAAYFASLAGELLFAADAASALPYHPTLLPTAVDAASEVIEHAGEALQPLLGQLAAALPARIAALHAAGCSEAAEELAHVFALFVGTHAGLCGGGGQQGHALRQGLLQLLALPLDSSSDGSGPALPALGALSDLLEHLVAARRRYREGEGAGEGEGPSASAQETAAFAAAALEVLLVQLQPFDSAFRPVPLAQPHNLAAQRGAQSPEGMPDAFRREAAALLDMVGDLMGPDAAVAALVTHAERAAQTSSMHSVRAAAALDASLLVLEGLASLLETCCSDRAARDPLPSWLGGVLQLYSLLAQVDGGRQPGASSAAPLTILHSDFLSGFSALGHLVVPLLQASHHQHLQAVLQLVLDQSMKALSVRHPRSADVAPGGGDDVAEKAAAALRTLCSAAASCGALTTPQLLAALEQGMLGLQQYGQQYQQYSQQYQEAHSQLVTALVHALHGIPPGDVQLRSQGEAAVQRHVLDPLVGSLAPAQQAMATAAAAAAGSPQQALAAGSTAQAVQAVRAALSRLHASLKQLQALLNGLESYWSCEDSAETVSPSGTHGSMSCVMNSDGGGTSSQPGEEAVRSVAHAAVGSLLACWPQLAEVCCWQGLPAPQPQAPPAVGGSAVATAGASVAAVRRELHQELAHCLSSCMALDGPAFQLALPSLAQTVASCWGQPGGGALTRPLMQAMEAYGSAPPYQQPLLSTAAAMLASPGGRQLAVFRGGDADPEAAQALLSLLGCCLRQACQWRQLGLGAPQELQAVLELGLPLAAANAAANHRDVSHAAVGALCALLALMLEQASPLHQALMQFARQRGAALLQGLLLALLSLNSSSHLPKVVSLMSDTALLAASLALTQQQQQQQPGGSACTPTAVCSAAAQLLGSWLEAARLEVVRTGVLPEPALAELLSRWDWQPVLEQAAAQLAAQHAASSSGGGYAYIANGNGSGRSVAEVRRAMQRSVRQLADLARRGGSGQPAAA